jgi:hypothetical protein
MLGFHLDHLLTEWMSISILIVEVNDYTAAVIKLSPTNFDCNHKVIGRSG